MSESEKAQMEEEIAAKLAEIEKLRLIEQEKEEQANAWREKVYWCFLADFVIKLKLIGWVLTTF